MTPFVRIMTFKNGQPYPVAHTHIAHIMELLPSPRSAVIKLLLIFDDMLVGRVHIRKVHHKFVINYRLDL